MTKITLYFIKVFYSIHSSIIWLFWISLVLWITCQWLWIHWWRNSPGKIKIPLQQSHNYNLGQRYEHPGIGILLLSLSSVNDSGFSTRWLLSIGSGWFSSMCVLQVICFHQIGWCCMTASNVVSSYALSGGKCPSSGNSSTDGVWSVALSIFHIDFCMCLNSFIKISLHFLRPFKSSSLLLIHLHLRKLSFW